MKINYQQKLDQTIIEINKQGTAPTLLLHSCCAPCSSYVLEYLSQYFKITVFFYNPNIYPKEEYAKRVQEITTFILKLNVKHEIKFMEGRYNTDAFYAISKGYESDKEGGPRCFACYELRLRESATIAKQNSFDYFTTTLSISPYKNAEKLNQIGEELSKEFGTHYLYSDFKKKNGYKRSIELSNEYNLYRQNYCGCIFSKRLAEEKGE